MASSRMHGLIPRTHGNRHCLVVREREREREGGRGRGREGGRDREIETV